MPKIRKRSSEDESDEERKKEEEEKAFANDNKEGRDRISRMLRLVEEIDSASDHYRDRSKELADRMYEDIIRSIPIRKFEDIISRIRMSVSENEFRRLTG